MKKFVISILTVGLLFSGLTAYAKTKYYGASLCKKNSKYDCYKVKRGDSWKKLFPNKKERDLVRRVNRQNVRLRRGSTIAIPNKLIEMDYYALSPFHLWIKPTGKKTIIYDPRKVAWAAYDKDGNLVKWGPAAGGNTWCSDVRRSCRTARGEFQVYRKGNKYCKSGKYPLPNGGAPMPFCMHFFRGFALHGSPTVPGYNASHGCVRLFVPDAKWLNKNFINLRDKNDPVKVVVLPYGKHKTKR
jgi:L,D-transpeptidase ErfK/SrfK